MRCSRSRVLFGASVALALAACTTLPSSDLKTGGMSATMTVVADGSGQTTVTAQINVDDNSTDVVTLSNGDTLFATAGTVSQTMTEDTDIFNDDTYDATFSGEDSPGTRYTIAFRRLNDVSAPDSTCTLPDAFTIDAPKAGSTFSRASSDIQVNLATSGFLPRRPQLLARGGLRRHRVQPGTDQRRRRKLVHHQPRDAHHGHRDWSRDLRHDADGHSHERRNARPWLRRRRVDPVPADAGHDLHVDALTHRRQGDRVTS